MEQMLLRLPLQLAGEFETFLTLPSIHVSDPSCHVSLRNFEHGFGSRMSESVRHLKTNHP
jgi:hypothetical protein